MRNKILDILKNQQREEFVSGESISQALSITRAAVWKQIQGLKEAGYEIEGQTKKGYRLVKIPCAIDLWALQQELRTQALGRQLFLFEELPSTNDRIKDMARQGGEHGTVVIAKRQTIGHGRMQRVWESPDGGLWLSLLLKPRLSLGDAAKLTLSAGVALAQTLQDLYRLEVRIKWPNDIVIQGRKLLESLAKLPESGIRYRPLSWGLGSMPISLARHLVLRYPL